MFLYKGIENLQFGQKDLGFIMDKYENIGFIYSTLSFAFISLFIGIIRSIIKR